MAFSSIDLVCDGKDEKASEGAGKVYPLDSSEHIV
jgi:hypothetical protein